MSCLARDLLIQDFYNEDGKPTEYGRSVLAEYPHLDIAGYEYCGIDAGSLFDHLAVNVFDDGLRGDLEALKSLYIQNLGEPDEYPPILIAPGQIRICTNCIRVDNPTGFIPPLGGNESVVTIYKLPWHQLPKNVKKSSSWM